MISKINFFYNNLENNQIYFDQFVQIIEKFKSNETDFDDSEKTFQIFDRQNKGFITEDDIKIILEKLGIDMTNEECKLNIK